MNSFFRLLVLPVSLFIYSSINAQDARPDTVSIGIYITSIHDIDFKQKEYTASFWIWLKYNKKEFDFYNNLEVPQAKTVTKSFVTIDSSEGRIYMQMKMQCVMKDSWRIENFPFDRQNLRISIENSQYDSRSMVFKPDTVGDHFDRRFTLRGWLIDSCLISSVDSAKLDEKAMIEFTGEYYSEEAEAKFYVSIKNGKLVMLQKPKAEFQLSPTYKDGFETPVGTVYFEREKNKIINFKISVGRARNVEFKKLNN